MDFLEQYVSKWTHVLDPERMSAYDTIVDLDGPPLEAHPLRDQQNITGSISRDWYTYSLSFSQDGRYLCFADRHKPCVTHIAVFELIREPRLVVRFIKSTRNAFHLWGANSIVFDAARPTLAFCADGKAWIWDFLREESQPQALPAESDRCFDEIAPPFRDKLHTCHRHLKPLTECTIKSVDFSGCGRYIIARLADSLNWLQIPETIQRSMSNTERTLASEHKLHLDSGRPKDSSRSLQLAPFGLLPGQVLHGTHSILSKSQQPQALVISSKDHNVKVESWRRTPSESNGHIQLLCLPQSFDTDNTNISLRLPMSSDDSFRIIVNSIPKRVYTLEKDRVEQSTMVIDRDISSISYWMANPSISNSAVNSQIETTRDVPAKQTQKLLSSFHPEKEKHNESHRDHPAKRPRIMGKERK